MIRLPAGIFTANGLSVKLQPIPRMTSAAPRKRATPRGMASPPAPSESGWVSGNALLPSSVVITGMAIFSASRFSCGQARA